MLEQMAFQNGLSTQLVRTKPVTSEYEFEPVTSPQQVCDVRLTGDNMRITMSLLQRCQNYKNPKDEISPVREKINERGCGGEVRSSHRTEMFEKSKL